MTPRPTAGQGDDIDRSEHKATRRRRPGPWTPVPNKVLSERRLRDCSTEARCLYALGWVFANHNRTDGEISPSDLRSLAVSMAVSDAVIDNAAAELARAELWEHGYRITDFLDWCDSAATIERSVVESRKRALDWQREKRSKREKAQQIPTEPTEPTGNYGVITPYAANAAEDDGTDDAARRRRDQEVAEAEEIARQEARRGGDAEGIASILARNPMAKRVKRAHDPQELPL